MKGRWSICEETLADEAGGKGGERLVDDTSEREGKWGCCGGW